MSHMNFYLSKKNNTLFTLSTSISAYENGVLLHLKQCRYIFALLADIVLNISAILIYF